MKGLTSSSKTKPKQRERKTMKVQNTLMQLKAGRVFQFAKRVALSGPGKLALALVVIGSLLSIPLATVANDRDDHDRNDNSRHEDNGLEGSWINTVSPILPPGVPPISFQTYVTVSAGGAWLGSDRTKPFAGPQHGTWVHVQGHEYAWTFVQDLFDSTGTFLGTFKGRSKVQLVGKNEYVGVANVEQRDASGNVVLARCARQRGVRVVVEPLAPPCEGLEPGM
jgi:hypothetical protein